jgi:hypothetical protein
MFDGQQLGETIVAQVKGFMEREIAPLKAANEALMARIVELEARPAPEKGEPGERGADGVSPEPEAIAAALLPAAEEIVADAVAKAVAALPAPERGEKGEAGERGESGAPGADGRDGADGADGRGVKDLLIDRDGNLVATMDDGEMKSLGPVVGKDGGCGADGRDGFGFDDLDVNVLDDDRTIEFAFRRGEEEKAFTLKWPTVIYRDVFKAGEQYAAGDAVTWGGSLWVAQRDTGEKPDTPDSGWKLAVKRGRDGKDAKPNG